jgi:hypothetical protein
MRYAGHASLAEYAKWSGWAKHRPGVPKRRHHGPPRVVPEGIVAIERTDVPDVALALIDLFMQPGQYADFVSTASAACTTKVAVDVIGERLLAPGSPGPTTRGPSASSVPTASGQHKGHGRAPEELLLDDLLPAFQQPLTGGLWSAVRHGSNMGASPRAFLRAQRQRARRERSIR